MPPVQRRTKAAASRNRVFPGGQYFSVDGFSIPPCSLTCIALLTVGVPLLLVQKLKLRLICTLYFLLDNILYEHPTVELESYFDYNTVIIKGLLL